jgi:hypothetical protein
MGAYLNTPVTEKEQDEGENEWIRFASTSMQGWRAHQEDSHNNILDFGDPDNSCSLFGVYDGHGGSEVAGLLLFLFQFIDVWFNKIL